MSRGYKTRKINQRRWGGAVVPVKQIMLNTPMRNALQKYNKTRNARFQDFKTDKNRVRSKGFYPILSRFNTVGTLSRMESSNHVHGVLNHHNFNRLLIENPVKLKPTAKITNSNGTQKTLYQVMNGRHRVVRAILNGKESIPFIEYT
jgi:hypothetical protein